MLGQLSLLHSCAHSFAQWIAACLACHTFVFSSYHALSRHDTYFQQAPKQLAAVWLQSASRQVPRHAPPDWPVWTLPFCPAHYDCCCPESSRYAWQPLLHFAKGHCCQLYLFVLALLRRSSVSCAVHATLLVRMGGTCCLLAGLVQVCQVGSATTLHCVCLYKCLMIQSLKTHVKPSVFSQCSGICTYSHAYCFPCRCTCASS